VIKTTDLPVTLPLRSPIQLKDLRIQADAHYPFREGVSLQESVNVPSLALAIVMFQSALQVNGSAVGGRMKLAATSPSINTEDLPITVSLKKPIEARNMRIEAEIEGTQARLHDLSLTLFGGQVKATGALTMGARPTPFESNVSLQGIQLGPVMDAVRPGKISISGTAEAQLALRGQGYSMPELTRALEGSGRLVIRDGRLEGVNLLKEAEGLLKVVGITTGQANATIFSLIEANARVKRGVLTVERAWMSSRDLQATAAGTIGFDRALNLRANVSLSEALSRSLGGPVPVGRLVLTKGRLSVPIIVTGTVQAPSVALDAKAVGIKVEKQVTEAMGGFLKGGEQTSEQFLKKGSESFKKLFGQ
jgi:AsmA protein